MFPEPVLPLWLERPGQVKAIFFDEKTTRMLPTRLDWVSRLEPLGSRRYRAEIRNNSPFVDPGIVKEGDTLVLPYRGYRQAVALVDCSGITLENVTVYGSGQMAFTEEGGEGGNAYRRCRGAPSRHEAADRLLRRYLPLDEGGEGAADRGV